MINNSPGRASTVAICLSLVLPAGCMQKPSYPAAAQEILRISPPADGRFHIKSAGIFSLRPDTFICIFRPGLQLDPSELQRAIAARGQSDRWQGQARTNESFGANIGPACLAKAGNQAIFVNGSIEPPDMLGHYKITFVVWQQDAVWAGVIERRDGLRADAVAGPNPVNDGPTFDTQAALEKRSRMRRSRGMDIRDLTKIFLRSVSR